MERRKETNKALQLLFSIIYNSESAFFSQLHIFVIPYFVSFTADSKCWVRGAKEAEVGSWGTFRRLWMFPQWAGSETEPWALRPQERTDRNGQTETDFTQAQHPPPCPETSTWRNTYTLLCNNGTKCRLDMTVFVLVCLCQCTRQLCNVLFTAPQTLHPAEKTKLHLHELPG